jgi:zinc/manganese transport system permease protein
VSPYDLLVAPFVEFAFMRRALVGCLALALACGPIGTLLVLRRMSLMGDAIAHAVLPGVAVGFMVAGLSIGPMSLGGLVAGLVVALLSGLVSRLTPQREDASFAAFYLISLALGVALISSAGNSVDLLHILFGSILAIDDTGLLVVAAITTVTLLSLALIYRPLVIECFDPLFLRALGVPGALFHTVFLMLVVLTLIGAFQALGTLLGVGLMMVPAAAARFWARAVWSLALASVAMALASSYVGLVMSFHLNLPSGPVIILAAGACYVGSIILGRLDSLRARYLARAHLRA